MKLNKIPLELDNRIFDIEDIKTVITADEKDVGKMGYFANSIHLFKNLEGLDGIKYGKLIYLSDLDYGGDKSDKCFVCSNQWAYRYFIPEDALKPEEPKKKYRPFTLNEFLVTFPMLTDITMREKGDNDCIITCTVTAYRTRIMSADICLGVEWISLKELFDKCEYKNTLGDWIPFGEEIEE